MQAPMRPGGRIGAAPSRCYSASGGSLKAVWRSHLALFVQSPSLTCDRGTASAGLHFGAEWPGAVFCFCRNMR